MEEKPTQSREWESRGSKTLWQGQGAAPLVGFGATPQLFHGRPAFQTRSTKGAGSEASLPVTLRSRRSAPKLLYPPFAHCRAKWARLNCWSCDHSCFSPNAGISPLRRRGGGFPIAPSTPSAPTLLGVTHVVSSRSIRLNIFIQQSSE